MVLPRIVGFPVLVATALLGCGRPTPPGDIVLLGDENRSVKVLALSADGAVAMGVSGPAAEGDVHASLNDSFVWTPRCGFKMIRTADGRDVWAQALSGDGRVVVGKFDDPHGGERLFRWTTQSGLEDLGVPAKFAPSLFVNAKAVSADGEVVFGSYGPSKNFRWTRKTGFQDFAGPVDAVSADGSVTAGMRFIAIDTDHVDRQLVRWTASRGVEVLGRPTANASEVWFSGLSADGATIVGDFRDASGLERGFKWTAKQGFQVLTGDRTAVRGVSGDGSKIVGMTWRLGAVEWTGNTAPKRVGPPDAGVARAVSEDGRTLAGQVFRPGYVLSFILRAP